MSDLGHPRREDGGRRGRSASAANGEAILGDRGQVVRVRSAFVTGGAVPDEWNAAGRRETDAVALARTLADIASRPGPALGGIDGVSDDDVDEFLASLRG